MDIEGLRPISHELRARKNAGEITKAEMLRLADEAAGIKPKAAVEKVIAERARVKQEPAKQAAARRIGAVDYSFADALHKQAAGKVGQSHDKIPNYTNWYFPTPAEQEADAARHAAINQKKGLASYAARWGYDPDGDEMKGWKRHLARSTERTWEEGDYWYKSDKHEIKAYRVHDRMERARTQGRTRKGGHSIAPFTSVSADTPAGWDRTQDKYGGYPEGKYHPATPGANERLYAPAPHRGTILVDIDSTLLGSIGDDLWDKLAKDKNLTPNERITKYLAKMTSDPKYSQMDLNVPLYNKLRELKEAGYDLKLWTDRPTALGEMTEANLTWAADSLADARPIPGDTGGSYARTLNRSRLSVERLGMESESSRVFSDLIMGGKGGEKLDRVPGGVVAIIDNVTNNLSPISAEESIDINLTGREKPGSVARVMKSDSILTEILERGGAKRIIRGKDSRPTTARQAAARQAAAKEMTFEERQSQQLKARQDATAARAAEHQRRLSLSPEEAAREQLLPHSDAALEHLAERKKTEKWQKQVRLELEGKSKPKLTLFKGGENYEKTTSAKDKKAGKKRFLAEMKREANIAPEELMFERAETARESKRYEELIERANKLKAEQDLLTPEEKAAQRASERDLVAEHRERVKRGEALPEIEQLRQHKKRRREAQQAAAQQAAGEQVAVQKAAAEKELAKKAAASAKRTATTATAATARQAGSVGASSSSPASVQQASSTRTSSSPASPSSPRVVDNRTPVAELPIVDRQKALRQRLNSLGRGSSSNPLRFLFDTEATDVGFAHRERIINKGKLVKYTGRDGDLGTRSGNKPIIHGQTQSQRAVGTQMLQFYGGTADEIANQTDTIFQRHMELDIPDAIKRDLGKSLSFDLHGRDGEVKNTFNAEQIHRIMTDSSDSLSADDLAARKAMGDPGGPQGKFHITDPKVLKNITASRLTNPTAGMAGVGVNLVNHTLNQVVGRSVFESKYGRPDTASSQKFVQDFLNRMVKLQKDAPEGVRPQIEAWNINYDLIKAAEQVDMYGKDLKIGFQNKMQSAKYVFKTLFIGTDAHSADYLIKAVDAADKIKEISFWRLINDNQYNVHSINHEEVAAALENGQTKAQIQDAGIEELRTSKTGVKTKYINRNTALRKLADDVGGQKNRAALADEFYNRIYEGETYSRNDIKSHKKGRIGQIVDDAVSMTLKIRESSISRDGNMIEALRRGSNLLASQDGGVDIANRIWRPTAKTSGIMGFGVGKDAEFAEGTAKQMMYVLDNSTGFDGVGGFSQGGSGRTVATGKGGAIGSLIYAKETYMETHSDSQLSNHMRGLFEKIDKASRIGGAAHDASIDTRQMHAMISSGGILDDMGTHGATTDMIEFNGILTDARAAASFEAGVDRWMVNADFAPQGSGASGTSSNILQEVIPEPQTAANAGDFSGRGPLNSVEPLAGRPRGLKGRGGVLAGGILTLAGLALVGNRNGGIKQPGSQYNSIEGMSPSGDPLIHSFGSGNDSFASQAITNLKYGTGYGSNTLRSSMLGYRGDRLRDILLGRSSFDDYTNSSEKGTLVHSIIEAEYLKRDIAQSSEHVVHSPELDVMGHIDLVLNSGVPLEIKSVEDFEALENLKSPKDAHVSQANFYAYALKQPYALIGYAARNDPKGKIKYFKVNTDIKRVRDDVEAVRRMMADLRRQGYNTQNYSAYQAMKDARSRFTQNKYQQNAAGAGAGLPSGMIPAPEDYGGHSAIKGLGDYGKWMKKLGWRQENKTHLTNTQQFKSKSRIRDQGKHAALHSNDALKYNARISHPNGSRQIA